MSQHIGCMQPPVSRLIIGLNPIGIAKFILWGDVMVALGAHNPSVRFDSGDRNCEHFVPKVPNVKLTNRCLLLDSSEYKIKNETVSNVEEVPLNR